MKRYMAYLTMAAILGFGLLGQSAQAEEGTAQATGLSTHGRSAIFQDGDFVGHRFTAEFELLINGIFGHGYCADLYTPIEGDTLYTADIFFAEATSPWCEIAHLLKYNQALDDDSGSAIQLAIWKLLYAPNLETTSDNAAIDEFATALALESLGQCPLMCGAQGAFDIEITLLDASTAQAVITLTQDGNPVAGQEVMLQTSQGVFISPSDAQGVTDDAGQIVALIDLNAAPTLTLPGVSDSDELTVSAFSDGFPLLRILIDGAQDLVAYDVGTGCELSASETFKDEPVGYGDPRTIGFWKHQTKSNLSGKGKVHVPASTLTSWLPLESFGAVANSLEDLHAILWLKKAKMKQRAQQQCMATRLNIEYGELFLNSYVDTDRDGQPDSLVSEALDAASDAFYSGDPETAKTICDNINNL